MFTYKSLLHLCSEGMSDQIVDVVSITDICRWLVNVTTGRSSESWWTPSDQPMATETGSASA
jgi:hypothetical protein